VRINKGEILKLIGCLLLLSGWLIVMATLDVLSAYQQRAAFLFAGLAVEGLGLALLSFGYTAVQRRCR
jgi:hypothetical protein